MLALIAAHDLGRVIGDQNRLPWHLPEDLDYFRFTTIGRPVIMGRKTFESLKRALPGRQNIVLTRDATYTAKDAHVFTDFEDALLFANSIHPVVFLIGGSELFEQYIGRADTLYITEILDFYKGDTKFPEYSEEDWELTFRSSGQISTGGIPYVFKRYARKISDRGE